MHTDLAAQAMNLNRWAAGLDSLKVRITAGFIASLVLALGLTTLVLVQNAERDTLREETRRELVTSVRTARVLSLSLVDMQRALAMVAAQLDVATLGNEAALFRFIEGKPVLLNLFSNVFVAAPDGDVVLVADEGGARNPDYSVADRDYFRRTMAEGRPIISEPLIRRVTSDPVLVLTHPVRGREGIVALLGGSQLLASRDLLANLVDTQETDEQALTVVTDSQGRVLAHPNRALMMQSLDQEPRLAAAFAAWVAAGSPVEPGGLQLRQEGEVVSAAGVAGPDWMVWRARPESELLAPLRSARRLALLWAGGLITLMSGITLLLVSWLLRPLRQLEKRAQHLFDGSMPAEQGWPEVSGEIGRLAGVLKAVGIERMQLELSKLDLLRRLGSVMTSAPIGIAFTREQCFELVSAEFCRLFGRSEAEFLNSRAEILYASKEDYGLVGIEVLQAFEAGEAYAGEWLMVRADGSQFWGRLRGRPVDAADSSAGTIWTVSDISAQKLAREELAWTAGHDPLTGLANRRAFERSADALVQGQPTSLPAAIICIDLDHFKPINDAGGHAAGDAMLEAVASAISSAVRATDLVARLGGDEFAVLLERCTVPAALRTAEHIRDAVAAIQLPWEQTHFGVGTSLGVAGLTADMDSVLTWLALADAACYEAKAAGRGVVRSAAQ
ncbi:MAG: diguanylate cyclase [Paucibacter sp.]|nr:diguanylate cyclase [Roseateles sp.]